MLELLDIVQQLDYLLPQLSQFIMQFNTTVANTGVSVLTDAVGNMELNVPQNMSDADASNVSTRIGIIDRLITTRGQEINELLQRGMNIEKRILEENPNHVSYLNNKVQEFIRLNQSYKH